MAWKREVWWYDCDIPASNSNIQWEKKEWEFGITQNLYSFVCLFFSANLIHGRVPEGPRHGAHHSMIITLNVFLATWLQLLKLLCVLVSRCIYFTIPLSFVSHWYLFYFTAPVQKFLVFFSTAWTRYGVVFDWGLIRYLWGVIWIHCWFLRTLHWSQDEQTCHSCHESYEYEDWDQILSSVRQRDSFRCSRQSVSRQSEVGESAVGESAHNQNDPGSQSWLEFFYISSTFSDCHCLSVELEVPPFFLASFSWSIRMSVYRSRFVSICFCLFFIQFTPFLFHFFRFYKLEQNWVKWKVIIGIEISTPPEKRMTVPKLIIVSFFC